LTERNVPAGADRRVARQLAELTARVDELEARIAQLEAPVETDRQHRQREIDQKLIGEARALAQVDRVVRGYHRRLRENDWPTFQIPPAARRAA
jgi:hypothetical protein